METIGAAEAADLARRLLKFYDRRGRKLPWRGEGDLYRIWLSEIMLQQTGVTTVIPYYHRFLDRFPDLAALGAAEEAEVLELWQGLGYYSRARNLLKAARRVLTGHDGRIPEEIRELVKLPGIGPSTAAAILAIGRGQRHAILDGNVKRVLARLTALHEPVDSGPGKKRLWELARWLTPAGRPGDYAQAIMDLGATLCAPRRPDCPPCPWNHACRAWDEGRGAPETLPVKRPKPPKPHRTQITLLIQDRQGRLLFGRRPSQGLLGGLWDLPSSPPVEGETETAGGPARLAFDLGLTVDPPEPSATVRHTFTHFHLTAQVHICRYRSGTPRPGAQNYTEFCWVDAAEQKRLAISTLHRKILATATEWR